ncbi:MAG: hypothetical protein ACNA8L_12730 [Luteolibacter sp.]
MPHFPTLAILLIFAWSPAHAQRPRVVPPPGESPAPAATAKVIPSQAESASDVAAEPESNPPSEAAPLIAALQAQNEAINRRITHRLAGDTWRPQSMPSGAAGMNLFSNFDHQAESYTLNPDLWAQDLAGQLTGAVIHNTHSVESYGGILITPRHVLFCAHAHPHAEGTWPPNPARAGAEHRFITKNGRLLKSTQLHQAKSFHNFEVEGLSKMDFCVALLDRDLEAEGLHVSRVFPPTSPEAMRAAMEWANEADEPFAFIGLSQGVGRATQSQPPEPIGDYPMEHAKMVYIKDRRDMLSSRAEPGPFAPWNYRVWDGDSGTPAFLLFKGELHLWMILTTAPGNGPIVGNHIDHIQSLIELADRNALEIGRLDEPTGHRLRVAEW